ncbi:ATP-binding cassette domain-containing protein [Microbispora hainanensis]|uniref:metal ABC transporter ATP-binding protein n=1 Tax=Microbispora TaxID=2005 RepID=UPI0011581B00|nr:MULTISPECIES: ATP-binding cassette domain-containing protein [Microbispora]NJP29549.1 ATP-binding cassette domain-containing protein [Microbispora sp. CL1-1]TQS05015.1 ATP-binding cassette domain-containing protein [Microbispora sp. SCL1-1]
MSSPPRGLYARATPLRLAGVTCRHGRLAAVDRVDLDLAPGEHLAITGTNGSGKSTLLRAILGLHRETSGLIEVGGVRASGTADWARRRSEVAWVPQRQTAGRFPLLVSELLASGGHMERSVRAAEELGVGDLLDRPLGTLSGGQLQRAYLARALGQVAAGAGLVLADEPTAALDFAGQEQVAGVLAGLAVTVVVVTHDRAVVEASGRVAEMAAGRLREIA